MISQYPLAVTCLQQQVSLLVSCKTIPELAKSLMKR